MLKFKLFINNEWVDAEDGGTFTVQNPATGEEIAVMAKATEADVKKAIAAAKQAHDAGVWSKLTAEQRCEKLMKAAEILERRLDEFALIESRDTGKTLRETRSIDIPYAIRALTYHARAICSLQGEVVNIPGKNLFDYVTYHPYGVAAIIAPWNFPVHLMTRGAAPALAAGNCVVLKASSLTPITTQMLGEVFLEAGFPAGVVNIVSGPGSIVGRAIMKSPEVEIVSFTGSEEVGRDLLHQSAESPIIKKLILELGGKSPVIVHEDADLERAANDVMLGFLLTQGEVCSASTRLLLSSRIYDEFMALLLKKINALVIGDPLDERTHIGSLIDENQLKVVDAYVQKALQDGAKLYCGGKAYTEGACIKGHYYMPTVLGVDNRFACAREEIFGPVLSVIPYDTIEEAVAIANDTPFGLGAAIYSENIRTLMTVGEMLDAGSVWENCTAVSQIEAPFGGNKNSGIGREDGLHGLKEYLKVTNHILCLEESKANLFSE